MLELGDMAKLGESYVMALDQDVYKMFWLLLCTLAVHVLLYIDTHTPTYMHTYTLNCSILQ